MKKQKNKLSLILCSALVVGFSLAHGALAVTTFYGNAIVSWVAPTTDEGGGALGGGTSDLAGYRVYYSTSAIDCADWGNAAQSDRQANTGNMMPATYQNVADPTKLKFAFSTVTTNGLTLGATYNFAVVAYDTSGNLSKCATAPDGTTTSVSKLVTFPADISNGTNNISLHKVDATDYSILHAAYNPMIAQPGNPADIADHNGTGIPDGYVDAADYSLLHSEYGQSF